MTEHWSGCWGEGEDSGKLPPGSEKAFLQQLQWGAGLSLRGGLFKSHLHSVGTMTRKDREELRLG